MKKTLLIIGLCCLLVIALLIACFVFKPATETTELQDVIGETLSLSQATPIVCELSDAELSDDFSQAFMKKTTITVLSLNEEETSATVKISAPDMEQILRNSLPADDAAEDYEALFAQYWTNVIAALENVAEEQMITQTVECPVIEQEDVKQISVANAPLFNYQQLLADTLLEMLLGSEG